MILIISPFFWPNVGGVETHLNDLCQFLVKKNIKTQVLTYQPITVKTKAKAFESKKNLDIRRFWWPGFNLFHKLEKLPAAFNFIYLTPGILFQSILFCRKNYQKIKCVHSQGLVASFVGFVLKKMFNLRLVISTHATYGFSNPLFTKISTWILNKADQVLALSQASKKELIRIGVKASKISVYVYWVDQQCFKPLNKQDCKEKLSLSNKFVVLFVGRLLEKKGAKILVNIAKKEPRITFVFVGTGPDEEMLKQEALKCGNIKFEGRIDNRKLPIYYNAADIFVIPSLYDEGFGRVIPEALSCGTPVIGSNRGGIKEALSSKVGMLVSSDESSFHQAIRKLFNDKIKLKSLAKNCRSYALEKFSDKNASLILKSYSS